MDIKRAITGKKTFIDVKSVTVDYVILYKKKHIYILLAHKVLYGFDFIRILTI